MQIMRNSLRDTISGSLKDKNPHAGLLLQRGLLQWDKDDKEVKEGQKKSAKTKIIDEVSSMTSSPLYEKAFKRWEEITTTSPRFAQTAAKIVGRLYTGLGVGTALETHLTTHHTYGMPMLAGSGVKGAVAAYAEKIGLSLNKKETKEIYQVLFGDEDKAGAVVWHDAWWIPNTLNPFVGEIVTTHHQEYYNGKQEVADEMENPIPNQQIACQGSFYFVVECDNPSWAIFANQLLFETLQNQGLGSKTASGYGYFVYDESEQKKHDDRRAEQVENIEKQKRAAELAALPEHERVIQKWQEILVKQQYKVGQDDNLYRELIADFQAACESSNINAEQKKQIAETLSVNKIKKQQANWISSKRETEMKSLLKILRGE